MIVVENCLVPGSDESTTRIADAKIFLCLKLDEL